MDYPQSCKSYTKNQKLAAEYAVDDINGAVNCDIFIQIPEKEGGTTQFAELGAAISSSRVKKIFVLGKYNTRSLAFFHPKVERIQSLEKVFSRAEKMKSSSVHSSG